MRKDLHKTSFQILSSLYNSDFKSLKCPVHTCRIRIGVFLLLTHMNECLTNQSTFYSIHSIISARRSNLIDSISTKFNQLVQFLLVCRVPCTNAIVKLARQFNRTMQILNHCHYSFHQKLLITFTVCKHQNICIAWLNRSGWLCHCTNVISTANRCYRSPTVDHFNWRMHI